jgi:hypothetical protein
MKELVLKQLRAVQKMEAKTLMEGKLYVIVSGSIDEHDQLLNDLKQSGWDVYRHYVQIGRIQIAILLY